MCNWRAIVQMLCNNNPEEPESPIVILLRIIGSFMIVLIGLAIFSLIAILLGIVTTLIIRHDYDIHTGCPNSNSSECKAIEKTMCYLEGFNLWIMCMLSGYIASFVLILIVTALKLIIGIFIQIHNTKSIFISGSELARSHCIELFILGIVSIYGLSCLLGIASTWIIYGKDYDIRKNYLFCNISNPGSALGPCGAIGLIPTALIFVFIGIICFIKSTIFHYYKAVEQVEKKDKMSINTSDNISYESI